MARKRVWIGSRGPFLFDDQNTYGDGVNHVGLRSETVVGAPNYAVENLTTNVRLVLSNADKEFEEVNDLSQWLGAGSGVSITDDGDGTVTITNDVTAFSDLSGSLALDKLAQGGANDNDFLQWDDAGSAWVPASFSGLSASADETITGQWTFESRVRFNQSNTSKFVQINEGANGPFVQVYDGTDNQFIIRGYEIDGIQAEFNEGGIQSDILRLTSTTDASLSSTGHAFQIGPTSGGNLVIDGNEILSRANGGTSPLHLNRDGGEIQMFAAFNNRLDFNIGQIHLHGTGSEIYFSSDATNEDNYAIMSFGEGTSDKHFQFIFDGNSGSGSGRFYINSLGATNGRIFTVNRDGITQLKSSNRDILQLQRTDNVGPVGIQFNDNDSNSQTGYFRFEHRNADSEGHGASFHFATTEPSLGVILDGGGAYYVGTDKVLDEGDILTKEVTWNPGNISSGSQAATTVTVSGASVGDAVAVHQAYFLDTSSLELFAYVSSADSVTVILKNTSGFSHDPSSRTFTIAVIKNT